MFKGEKMAFENNNFKVVKKVGLPKSELNLSCKVTAEGDISKIFALSFNAYATNQEITDGVASYNGRVDICMIYQLESGEIGSTFASCPFSSKFESDNIKGGEKAIISLKEIDHSIESVVGNEATVGIVLEQQGILIQTVEHNSITSNDENMCMKEEEVSVFKFVGSGTTSATENAVTSSREKIKKVLAVQSNVVVKEALPGDNFVTTSGDIVTNVLFIDENDKFSSNQIFDSFKEEIQIEGVTRASTVEAIGNVLSENIVTKIEEDDRGGKITISVPFEITAYAFEETKQNMVVDLYSTNCELEITTESFDMSKNLQMECVEGKVDGSLTLDLEQPRVDKILFTFASSAQVTNTFVSAGELSVEGIAKTTVVYLNDDTGTYNAVEIEVPFVLSDKTKASENAVLLTNAILTDVDVAVKKGREIFFDGKVRATVIISEDNVSAVISQAKEGEALNERDYAMQLVFAKEGASLWDIAKMSRVKESMISQQNPLVAFPLAENKGIIIFYQNK